MAKAKVTIWLNPAPVSKDKYCVKRLKNTVDYRIGDYVSRESVESMIRDGWEVNVIEN